MAGPKLAEQFSTRLKKALMRDDALRDLNGFIKKEIKSEATLLECLWQYCMDFSADGSNFDPSAKHRGLAAGYSLFSRAIELADQLNDLADLVPRMVRNARDPSKESSQPYLVYASRWSQLPAGDRTRLEQLARKKAKELRDRQTLISPLIKAYVQKEGGKPDVYDLLDFDPAPNEALRKLFDASVAQCEAAWGQFSPQGTHARPTEKALKEVDTAFERFAAFLRDKASEPLECFQVLRWTREGSLYRPGKEQPGEQGKQRIVSRPSWSFIWHELYQEACAHILRMGVTRWNMLAVQQARELPKDDRPFFLEVYRRLPQEAEKLAWRLKHLVRNAAEFTQVQGARRRDQCFADYANLKLLDELEVRDLQNQIAHERQTRPKEVSERVIQVLSRQAVFQDRYRVGQSVMEDFTIIWIEKDDPRARTRAPLNDKVIVEFHNRDCVLFRTDADGLETLVKNAFYKMLARNAQALAVFMLAYLELIGLVADVITAGAAGGFRRVLFELIKERVKEKAVDAALDKLGVDNPVVRTVAGMGANFVHLPKGKAKVPGQPDPDFHPQSQRADALDKGQTLDRGDDLGKPAPWTADEQKALRDQDVSDMDAFRQRRQAQEQAEAAKRAEELAQLKQQRATMSRASGDSGGGGVVTGHVDSDVPAPTNTRSTRSGSGSSGSSSSRPSKKERHLQSVPDFPVPARNVRKTPMNQIETVRDFYTQNIKAYPRRIQKMIRDLPQPGTRALRKEDLARIDEAIRQEHTDIANRLTGHARSAEKPFIMTGRSTANEGGMFAMLTTDQKHLSLHGRLKSGAGTVEFDSVEFRSSRIIETKMNLYRKTDDEIFDQMYRQVTFASDWKFSVVRWEVWDPDDVLRAAKAWRRLNREFPHLAQRVQVENPNAPW